MVPPNGLEKLSAAVTTEHIFPALPALLHSITSVEFCCMNIARQLRISSSYEYCVSKKMLLFVTNTDRMINSVVYMNKLDKHNGQ